ncbi:MAG: hypothetical protein ACOY3P_26955 [Planctomycetota bacterium]
MPAYVVGIAQLRHDTTRLRFARLAAARAASRRAAARCNNGKQIAFPNGQVVEFEHPVSQLMQFGEVLVVQIWPGRETYNENVFGLDLSGNVLWQIAPQYSSMVDNAAFGGLENQDGLAMVSNIKDLVLHLDPATGKIVKRYFQPR